MKKCFILKEKRLKLITAQECKDLNKLICGGNLWRNYLTSLAFFRFSNTCRTNKRQKNGLIGWSFGTKSHFFQTFLSFSSQTSWIRDQHFDSKFPGSFSENVSCFLKSFKTFKNTLLWTIVGVWESRRKPLYHTSSSIIWFIQNKYENNVHFKSLTTEQIVFFLTEKSKISLSALETSSFHI